MGQYWLPVNLDKKEFIDPHQLGNGLKLWEQLASHPGTGAALIILLAAMPEARGGGDLEENPNVIGRWTGDRIVLIGDYAKNSDLKPVHNAKEIYSKCREGVYQDITPLVAKVIENELDGHFEGDGWKDFVSGEGKPLKALRPDMIISVKE